MNLVLTSAVTLEWAGNLLIATVDNPPVNALSHAVRVGLVQAVAQLQTDPAARALLILCAGRTFSVGADIREFDQAPKTPELGGLIAALEGSAKPVIAAVHGTTLGGGLEVALACHARIAAHDTRLGVPEVTLGILPGSGGTVRLPRLIGIEKTLQMIAGGVPISARDALDIGLVDRIAEGDLRQAALTFATGIVQAGQPLRRTSALPIPPVSPDFLPMKRIEFERTYRDFNAPKVAIDLLEMVMRLPFREAAEAETAICTALVPTLQSRALRGLFKAEREVAKVPGLPLDLDARVVRSAVVVGAGPLGRSIAICLLNAEIPVTLICLPAESQATVAAEIRKSIERRIQDGENTASTAMARMAALTLAGDLEGIGRADLLIEALSGDLATRTAVFIRLDGALRPGATVAAAAAGPDLEQMTRLSGRAADVVGMQFFVQDGILKLIEVSRTPDTAPGVIHAAMGLGRTLRQLAVLTGGGVANRMLASRQRATRWLLDEGATLQQVNKALTEFGLPANPLAPSDHDALTCLGQAQMISDTEIVERCLLAIVNEAARVLDAGLVMRAGDIDVIWTSALGWPRHLGGPMFWADQMGLPRVKALLDQYAARGAGGQYTPAAGIERLAAERGSFLGLGKPASDRS